MPRLLLLIPFGALLACTTASGELDASPDAGQSSDAGLDFSRRLPDLSFDLGCEPPMDCIDPGAGCRGTGRCTGLGNSWTCVCLPDGSIDGGADDGDNVDATSSDGSDDLQIAASG